ncbi:MAG: chemotaxis protein CheW [Pseudomonadota bacterium]
MDKIDNLNHNARYITFKLADNLIGIDILDIREIVPGVKITKVQQAPQVVQGLMNLRGRILTVLDIGVLLGLEKTRINKDNRVIVFKHKDVGFLVDQIGDVVAIDQQQIEPVPANIDIVIKRYLDHIIHLDDQIIMALNSQKILAYTPNDHPGAKEYA